jgi:hypothetical protein
LDALGRTCKVFEFITKPGIRREGNEFRKILVIVNLLQGIRFKGEIVARMTVGEETEIDRQRERPDFWQNPEAAQKVARRLKALKAVKQGLDPKGILNPGKIWRA